MIAFLLTRWFFRPARCAAPAERAQVAEPPLPVTRALRPAAAPSAVRVETDQTSDRLVIRVKGDAGVESSGALLGGLLAASALRPALVTLDLSELRSVSTLAMGVLVAYRRGVVRAGGRVVLDEVLQPAVYEALDRAQLLDLFGYPRTVVLSPAKRANAPVSA
jgi:anti-anti-sigma regulatory factor